MVVIKKMKAGLYKCTHCGHIARRDSKGRNQNGTLMGLRCEKCQFDTMYHQDWWLHGLGVLSGENEKYLLARKREFEEAEKSLPLPEGSRRVKCNNCGHEWVTKSKGAYVTCPGCLKKIKL